MLVSDCIELWERPGDPLGSWGRGLASDFLPLGRSMVPKIQHDPN